MNFLNGVKNFMVLLSDNWLTIAVIIGLGVNTYKKIKAYLESTDAEKESAKANAVERAKQAVAEVMLKYVCRAEDDYAEWVKAGAAKRAEVIDKVFSAYPILQEVADRDSIIAFIDEEINRALKTMRELVKAKEIA